MIRVTIWNEHIQEAGDYKFLGVPEDKTEVIAWLTEGAKEIAKVHPNGMNETLAAHLRQFEDLEIRTVTLDMPDCGLPDEVLDNTDVLIWWAHIAHHMVPDELAEKIHQRVLKGMGFIALHSAHPSKPLQRILGTSGSLQWREGDFCRVWCTCPTHPIAEGIPLSFELPEEEMYGEFFDIPKPDDLVFTSWFRGGEVFRSGCTWTRGYGRGFYFQPGHETNASYHNEYVLRIIQNAVYWCAPVLRRETLDCPHAKVSPESKYHKE